MDKIFFNISFSLLCGIFIIFALSFTGFIFHINVNPFYAIIGLITTFAVFNYRLYLNKNEFGEKTFFLNLIFILAIISVWMLASTFPDLSWDGIGYHKPTAYLLAGGYNPIYGGADVPFWAKHYPKFSEIFAANIFSLTKNIESGKVYNHLAAIAAFCYTLYILSKGCFNLNKTPKIKFLLTFLLIYNPVVLCQLSTYCTDCLLYLYFLISALSVVDFYTEENTKLPLLIFIMSTVILANIKLGGMLCFISFIIAGLFFIENKKKLKAFYLSVLAIIFLILLSGINPYFTNIKNGNNPFYPILGKNKIDIITHNAPKSFKNKPSYYKFFYSTFSKTDNIPSTIDREPVLKIPFTIHKGEIKNFENEDVRIAGFGVLFSGIFILSLFVLFITKFKTKEDKKLFLLLYTLCGLPVILNPENWWARYIPYLWSFTVFAVIGLYINSKNKFQKLFSCTIIFLMFLNSFIVNIENIKPYIEQNRDGFCLIKQFITGEKCDEIYY